MTSLKLVEGVGDRLLNINRENTKEVKDSNPNNIKCEGWVYESQRSVGFSQESMIHKTTISSTDVTLVINDEPSITSPCLINNSINSTETHPRNLNSQSDQLCCDNYREQDQRKAINCCCYIESSTSRFPCLAVGDQELLTKTSCFCATNSSNIKKANSTFCSRMLRYSKIPSGLVMMLLTISCLCIIIVQTKPSSAQQQEGSTFNNNDKNKSDKVYENARTTNNAALVSSSATVSQEDALSISFPQPPDPESLPPDTFRKLAQALYQRGDKAENRLSRKFFYNHEVTCNDGTSAGYYIRRNYQSKRWIVFLEGGWICHDDLSCSEREARETQRMSSDRWPSVKTIGGILSADSNENPHFSDANHVFVPYCSSDSWSGTRKGSSNERSFMGSYIVREVIKELSEYNQLLFGEELYLAGSSAGGTGVLVNIDAVAAMLSKSKILVRGIIDSGWFLDNDPFFNNDATKTGVGPSSVKHALQKGVKLWNARVPSACASEYPDKWQCFLGYKVFPFIKTPLFIFQWQFDRFQMYADNVAIPTSKDQWDYVQLMSNNLRETFSSLSTVFSPACIAHEVFLGHDWINVEVSGVTLPDALECWASSLPTTIEGSDTLSNFDEQVIEDVFSSMLSKPDHVIQSQWKDDDLMSSINSKSPSMIADEPRMSYDYKLSRNLVRKIKTPSELEEENSRNSISNRANIPVRQRNSGKIMNNRTDHRRSQRLSKYKNRSEKRRKMKRLQRRKERCVKGDMEACEKLRKNHGIDIFEDGDEMTGRFRQNSNLVRSLDRRSSRKGSRGNDKSNTDRRKRKSARQRNLERRRAKQLRKQKRKQQRRQQRRERKRRQREKLKRRREARKNKRRKKQNITDENKDDISLQKDIVPSPTSAGVGGKHHLKVRSVEPSISSSSLYSSSVSSSFKSFKPKKSSSHQQNKGQCKPKLIDNCSWPHCNRSCPKLKNPKTGQEIDFLTLLQSFGVDIGSFARALGVDITTLINMDKDVLLDLLTSHSSSNNNDNNYNYNGGNMYH